MKQPVPAPKDWEVMEILRVIDGDTVDLLVRRGVGELDGFVIEATGVIRVRVVHLDTPERDDQPGYDQAADDAADWLYEFDKDADGGLRVTTQGKDAFGRYLGDIYADVDRSETLTDHMVREKGWPAWPVAAPPSTSP